MTKSEQREFYQHYTDRLAALIEGPEGYDMGEEKQEVALLALVNTLPETPWKPSGFRCNFDPVVFDRDKMKEVFEKGDPENLYEEVLEPGAQDQWEYRNQEAIDLLDRANMLEYYATDLSSDAMKKAKQFYAEGVPIAKAIGLQVSDHKLSVQVKRPELVQNLKRDCVDHTISNRDDFITVDVRARKDRAQKAFVDLYGTRSELLGMVDYLLDHDIECEVSLDSLVKTEEKVPGYLDGESYHTREVNKRSVSEKIQREYDLAFG